MKKVLLFSGLCGLSALLLLARSPGGVEGVDAWFKAAPVSGNLQGRYQWLDFSGDSVVQYAQNRSNQMKGHARIWKWVRVL